MELTEFRVTLESWNTAKTGSQGEMAKGGISNDVWFNYLSHCSVLYV